MKNLLKKLYEHSSNNDLISSYGSTLLMSATSATQGPGGGKLEGTSLRRNQF